MSPECRRCRLELQSEAPAPWAASHVEGCADCREYALACRMQDASLARSVEAPPAWLAERIGREWSSAAADQKAPVAVPVVPSPAGRRAWMAACAGLVLASVLPESWLTSAWQAAVASVPAPGSIFGAQFGAWLGSWLAWLPSPRLDPAVSSLLESYYSLVPLDLSALSSQLSSVFTLTLIVGGFLVLGPIRPFPHRPGRRFGS